MLAEEEGPKNCFVWFRFKVTGRLLGMKGASCVWCMSVWVALIFTGLLLAAGYISSLWLLPVWWLGLSASAIITHTAIGLLIAVQ
jgi:hypothetical protein